MKLSEHKELKKEILALPIKEKDKILLRLVAKDKVLTEHLHFLLLEDESDLSDRINAIKSEILSNFDNLSIAKSIDAKDALANLRRLSKDVNHNFRVTKAIFEDVELRIFLYNHTPLKVKFGTYSSYKNYTELFNVYFVKSVLVTLRKFYKLHEDLQFDLKDEMNKLLSKIADSNMASIAGDLNLPRQL
ncbi:MAG: hypothetical protein V4546_11345 [Bacteroidota bacterium]